MVKSISPGKATAAGLRAGKRGAVGKSGDSDFDALSQLIAGRYREFPNKLQMVARYALDHPGDMALETIAVISGRIGVQPSALIRFARALGFAGFSDMQRIFRNRLLAQGPSYGARIHEIRSSVNGKPTPFSILDRFALANIQAAEQLRRAIAPDLLARAVSLLRPARTIHIAGQRRSFPIAVYFAYLLGQLGRSCHLIDNVGGLAAEQTQGIDERDALIVISFSGYTPAVIATAEQARASKAGIVAITDGELSPLRPLADICLFVREIEVGHFRSIGASMCLALALCVALGTAGAGKKGQRK